jgi:hypothetical protein
MNQYKFLLQDVTSHNISSLIFNIEKKLASQIESSEYYISTFAVL